MRIRLRYRPVGDGAPTAFPQFSDDRWAHAALKNLLWRLMKIKLSSSESRFHLLDRRGPRGQVEGSE